MDDRKRCEAGREAADARAAAGVQILTGEPNQQPTPRVRLVGCARTYNTTEPTTPTGAQRLRALCSHYLTRTKNMTASRPAVRRLPVRWWSRRRTVKPTGAKKPTDAVN